VIGPRLRDAGMEVILYRPAPDAGDGPSTLRSRKTCRSSVFSILSGAHNAIVPRVMDLLKQNKMDDVLVLVGASFPIRISRASRESAWRVSIQPGTPMDDIVKFIRAHVKAARCARRLVPRGSLTRRRPH